jgi:hypothetical protein
MTRLYLRLGIIVVVIIIFLARREHYSPQMVTGIGVALAFALVFAIVRAVMDSKRKKQLEHKPADGRNVDLFTKPKDY